MDKKDSEYIKIGEAAQFLGVSRRTVYRRIWSGDLAASKVGGLYYIRRADLEAMLDPERKEPPPPGESRPQPALKCGACFRLLESDAQIGGLCQAEGCEALVGTQCWKDGIRHCVKHTPDRDHMWERVQKRYRQGEVPVLVKSNQARLSEINFLGRIQERVSHFDTLVHPLSGDVLTISNWDEHLERGDQRAKVMELLGKFVLDTGVTGQNPLNAWVRWEIPPKKRQKGGPVGVRAQVLSRLPEMLRDGFDTQPLNADALTTYLLKAAQEAQETKTATLLVVASTTGWDEDARQVVLGEDPGTAFAHRLLLTYLFDLQSNELIYSPRDERLQGYAEFFKPLLPSEEIEQAIANIEKEMLTYESLTLQQALESLPHSQEILGKAFEKLAASGDYALTEVPELGTAIIRT